jgi:hypothetical protein
MYSPQVSLGFTAANVARPARMYLPIIDWSQPGAGTPADRIRHVPLPEPENIDRYSSDLLASRVSGNRKGSFAPESQYCDERLNHLLIGFWTPTPIGDETAARAISLFLETTHPILSFFDADLFLSDLVHHRHRFCSPFLVSALLSYACVRQDPSMLALRTPG